MLGKKEGGEGGMCPLRVPGSLSFISSVHLFICFGFPLPFPSALDVPCWVLDIVSEFLGQGTGLLVGGEDVRERGLQDGTVGAHGLGDDVPDARQRDETLAETLEGHLVGGVHGRRQGAANPHRLVGEIDGREGVAVGLLEGQRANLRQVEPLHAAGDFLRPGQGVLDRETHVRGAQLRQHRPVDELHQ